VRLRLQRLLLGRNSSTSFSPPFVNGGNVTAPAQLADVTSMLVTLSGTTPPVTHFRILYVVLFFSACGATLSAVRLPRWLNKLAR
jgi:hypothetical protein